MTQELLTEKDFMDSDHWLELAKARKLRLPLWRMNVTTGRMRVYLKRMGRDPAWYLEHTNEKTLRVFAQRNPTWPLRSWVGICLEWIEEEDGIRTP